MLEFSSAGNKSLAINILPLFSDLSFFQRKFIEARTELVEFKKGEIIYNEGDLPDYFYCMVSGRVEIYHPSNKTKAHKAQRIECVRRGDYFGSISSLTGKPHTVSARALNDSVLLRINTKEFNRILRKIPKLAILLSRSLSKRLSRKTHKEIFESKIIAVYSLGFESDASSYLEALGRSLREESRKKVIIIESTRISKKRQVSSTLSSFTKDFHYVLVEVKGKLREVNIEILKQVDICHIISPPDRYLVNKAEALAKRLRSLSASHITQSIYVILKEGEALGDKSKIEVFGYLPKNKLEYKKTIRRIARETSGVQVGLVLGSGAAMGLAHVGVLKVLEKEKIPIDIIAATSIGALIASLWAVGFSASRIEKMAYSLRSKLRTLFLLDPILPIRGFIRGRVVRRILAPYLGKKRFSDLKLPLKIVACDIKKRSEFIIDKGKLIDAVMASIAIPGVFEPAVYNNDTQLVDGGIVNPVPVSVLVKEGVKRIIAVNTLPSSEDIVRVSHKKLNIYNIIVNSFQVMEYSIATHSCKQADVYLHPIPKLADWYEFYKAKLFIKAGQDHAKLKLAEIKSLIRR